MPQWALAPFCVCVEEDEEEREKKGRGGKKEWGLATVENKRRGKERYQCASIGRTP